MERFFQECNEPILVNLRSNATLDKLWSMKIITKEEMESIENLNSKTNVRKLIFILQTKSAVHLDTIIGIIEETTAGQEQHWRKLREMQSRILENGLETKSNQLLPNSDQSQTCPQEAASSQSAAANGINSALVPTERRSEVNRLNISENNWIVSLARKPDSTNYEHVFIIIEGIQNSEAVIWFIDFVAASANFRDQVGLQAGKIRLEKPDPIPMSHYLALPFEARLIFAGTRSKFILKPREHLLASSWQLRAEDALAFIRLIEQKINDESFPKFTILGNKSVFSECFAATKSGYNCFTWAQAVLLELKEVKDSQILNCSGIQSWINSATSTLLRDNGPNAKTIDWQAVGLIAIGVLLSALPTILSIRDE